MERPLALASLSLALLALVGTAAAHASPLADEQVRAVHLLARVTGERAAADARPKYALASAGVTLYAVIETEREGKRRFYSEAGRVRVRGRVHGSAPMAEAPPLRLRWFRVEPEVETLSNTASGRFRFEAIPYRETAIAAWDDRASAVADVRPTLTSDRGQGVGTMRYKLVAHGGGRSFATPGVEARRKRGSGGLEDTVLRVSLRRSDDYLGLLDEMFGQPYIWASGGSAPQRHQSERLEGSDCADFVVYGMRRLGHDIPYTWSAGLHEYTRTLSTGTPRADGVYTDEQGQPLRFPRPGDLVLFPRHVGVLTRDRGVRGVLDTADIMTHTLFASPRAQPIGETVYAVQPVEILRWPALQR